VSKLTSSRSARSHASRVKLDQAVHAQHQAYSLLLIKISLRINHIMISLAAKSENFQITTWKYGNFVGKPYVEVSQVTEKLD